MRNFTTLLFATLFVVSCSSTTKPVPAPRELGPLQNYIQPIVIDGVEIPPMAPIKIANPYYPRIALEARQEGWVLVELTVDTVGATKNISVVDSSPKGVFEKNAVHAVKSFLYQPAVVNGKAVEVKGVLYKLTFKL